MIVSVSGARGVFGSEKMLTILSTLAFNFAYKSKSKDILVGVDTRTTSEIILRCISPAVISSGKNVLDAGKVSTPALYRESRIRRINSIMITASHNPPEWNGVKFVVSGEGIDEKTLRTMTKRRDVKVTSIGKRSRTDCTYNEDFLNSHGLRFNGLRIVADLGGGSAIFHAPKIFSGLGCKVYCINDTPGFFSRIIDPFEDELKLLCKKVKQGNYDAGFAFDSDGDRLAFVDKNGEKKTGDFMLCLAISEALKHNKCRKIVVSVDTTQAVDEIARKFDAKVYRSKVGEYNVVNKLKQVDGEIGGEGSSGGLIEPSFNFCRDSSVASYYILSFLKYGNDEVLDVLKNYFQYRTKISFDTNRTIKLEKIFNIQRVDRTDGIKLWPEDKSWVLIRKSNTEPVIRISVESDSKSKAMKLAEEYKKIILESN